MGSTYRSIVLRLLVVAGAAALLSASVAGPAVLAQDPSGDPPNAYVALGDSFTSAPLVLAPTGDPIDCGRSTGNYPHLVAGAIDAPVFRDVSCGSAKTDHFSRPQTGLPLGGTNPPQYDALGPEVALVTMGIGGNDMGFGGIVDRCLQPPTELGGEPCTGYYTQDGGDLLSERIAETAPKIAGALEEIRLRAPSATVLVVDYPAILPHTGDGCYPYVPILAEDVPYLRAKQEELNGMLAAQAAAAGAHFVDTYGPSRGHDACQPPGLAWVNGIVVVPPSYPVHPNNLGALGMAQEVLRTLERIGFAWPTGVAVEEDEQAARDPGAEARDPDEEPRVLGTAIERPVAGAVATGASGAGSGRLADTGPGAPVAAGLVLALFALGGAVALRARGY